MLIILGYIVLGIVIYNVPSMIALLRLHNNGHRIVMMNMVLGWTIVGWFTALFWSLQSPTADYK